MDSEKVITEGQTDNKGDVGQPEVKSGDNSQTSVSDETDKQVPLKALLAEQAKHKSEKEAREKSEAEINALRFEIAQLRQQSQPKKDAFEGRDDYEPITIAEFKQREQQLKSELAGAIQVNKITESALRARERYKDAELNYDDALKIFQSDMFTNEERMAILNSTNPGEKMYKYVKANVSDDGSKKAQEMAQKITANVNQAQTLSSATKTASKSFNKLKELKDLTPQQIGQKLDEIVRQKRGG